MRISSNLILLATATIPGINGSSFVSRGLITAKLAKQKVTEKRQLSDGIDMDMSNPAVICAMLLLSSTMDPDPDSTMTMGCNEDSTEMEVSDSIAIEICDDKNEFCQKDTLLSQTVSLVDMSEEMSDATSSMCTTYTKVPSDEFMELVDKELCVNGVGKINLANMFDSADTDTDSGMMETCTANIGDDICTCSVCENDEIKLLCPTLGFNTEGGCTSVVGDDDSPSVIRFTKVEPTDSAASVALPVIGLFMTLTLATLLV